MNSAFATMRIVPRSRVRRRFVVCAFVAALVGLGVRDSASEDLPDPKPVPRMQVIPLPYDQASFQRDGVEVARYHFGSQLHRPFVFPLVGPSGRSLTRMGHPHDPITHSHHNSLWISHHDVDGVSFWDDQGNERIVHQRIRTYEDGDRQAFLVAENAWVDERGNVLLDEIRRIAVQTRDRLETLSIVDIEFRTPQERVVFGKTPFGVVGVRVAKTIGVHDGGGMIRNSEGGTNEKDIFWKRARWVDYSGPITNDACEGLTLFDHPSNPNHPTVFHVRNDGWMGASLTHDAPLTLERGDSVRLRYGILAHEGVPEREALDAAWQAFAESELPDLGPSK